MNINTEQKNCIISFKITVKVVLETTLFKMKQQEVTVNF